MNKYKLGQLVWLTADAVKEATNIGYVFEQFAINAGGKWKPTTRRMFVFSTPDKSVSNLDADEKLEVIENYIESITSGSSNFDISHFLVKQILDIIHA